MPTPEPAYAPISGRTNAVVRAVEELRSLIRNGDLQPGEHILQAQLAAELGMSRVPIREALKVLATEGPIEYSPNHGYHVAKMDPATIDQLHTMRRLLETELLTTIEWPTADVIDGMEELNARMRAAARAGDTLSIIQANREFHFSILRLSPHDVILREVDRLWSVSDAYRAMYHYSQDEEGVIYDEHERMVSALRDKDPLDLIALTDEHREQARRYVHRLLGGRLRRRTADGPTREPEER